MTFSTETQAKINELFSENEEMKARLLSGDSDAIREVGTLSQMRIAPEDVVSSFDSNDEEALKNLYNKAKTMVGLRELYKTMCRFFFESKLS